MKSEKEITEEMERLYKVFMDPANKKPVRDDAFIKFHALVWVLENAEDVFEKRLSEIRAGRNKTTVAK